MNIKDNLHKFHHIRKKTIDTTSNIINPVVKPVVKHITKHHKKYIFGTMGSLLTYFFFIKVFLFKVVVIKAVLAILAIFGIYSWNTTFAEVQPMCINNINFIPLSTCKINFTNIKDATLYLENKIKVPDTTMYDSISYQTLHETLQNYCPKNINESIEQIVKNIIKLKTSGLPKEKYKKLEALSALFATYKKHMLEMQQSTGAIDDFCQKKYIDYALTSEVKKSFIAILSQADLNGSQNSVFESIDRKDDTILGPLLNGQITTAKKSNQQHITMTNQPLYDQYYDNGSYIKTIGDKVIQLTTAVINDNIQRLKDKKVLTSSDINALDNKIIVKYTPNCRKTQGSTTIEQTVGTNNKMIKANIKNITLNINICFNYQYMQNLQGYIQQIAVHELGHYVYYVKDNQPQSFEKLCRKNNKISCSKNEFSSKYAQSKPAEDYAESFLHRYLGDSATTETYVGHYYSGNYYSGYYVPLTKNVLAAKLNYFSKIF